MYFHKISIIALLLILALILLRIHVRRMLLVLRRRGKLRLRVSTLKHCVRALRIMLLIIIVPLSIPVLTDAAGAAIIVWAKTPHRLSERPFAVFEDEMTLYADRKGCRWRCTGGTKRCSSGILSPPIWYSPTHILSAWPFENVFSCIQIRTHDGQTGWVDIEFNDPSYLIDPERKKPEPQARRRGIYPTEIIIRASAIERYIFDNSETCLACADGRGTADICSSTEKKIIDEGEHVTVMSKVFRSIDHMPCLEIEMENGIRGWILGLGEYLL